jgi:hypothetical protein
MKTINLNEKFRSHLKSTILGCFMMATLMAPAFTGGSMSGSDAYAQSASVDSEEISLDRLQHGINEVRKNAEPEELPILNAMQEQVHLAREQERKQTLAGRVASKAGLATIEVLTAVYRPFVFGTGYLVGRFEKRSRLENKGNGSVQDLLALATNRLRDLGEGIAADIGDRALRGEPLTRTEIDLLISKFPSLDMRWWEDIASVSTGTISFQVARKVLNASGVVNIGPAMRIIGISSLVAITPCLVDALSKEPSKNLNFRSYCQRFLDIHYTGTMTSRIRGYLRGVKHRNR